ncbi:MAG: DUF4255 domain-containing protein [Cytophagia bacterium]|nr:DUF4255 domain-containing protein [Cytophagia bacterium]
MIYETLNCIVKELNEYLKIRFNIQDDKAILNSILNQDGSIPESCLNMIVLSLINLEHDTNIPYNPVYNNTKEKAEQLYLPYNFNMDVLITAVFENKNYDEGLKFLSQSIYFFQGKPMFNPDNTSDLTPGIQQIGMELIKLSYHEEHSLWGAMGAKYMPSVLFKIRLISFQRGIVINSSSRIQPDSEVTAKPKPTLSPIEN